MDFILLKSEYASSKKSKYKFDNDYVYVQSLSKLKNKNSHIRFMNQKIILTDLVNNSRKRFSIFKSEFNKKNIKTFFRIEHSSKKNSNNKIFYGPYVDVFSYKWKSKNHSGQRYPGISKDHLFVDYPLAKVNAIDKKYLIYGFKSLKQLTDWFSYEELQKLDKLGFVISTYKSKEYICGIKQVGFVPFKRLSATKITKIIKKQ